MKIGILGGTFNPIHYGHLRIAEEVRERFDLARVIFVPAATPPHKTLSSDLLFEHRFRMVSEAVAGNPLFEVSDIEGLREGPSYLIDTLRELRRNYPEDELFFIMGSDSFADIRNWKEYAGYFSLCNIVVVERPGAEFGELANSLPDEVAREFTPYPAEKRLAHCSGYSVYMFTGTLLDISSSNVRLMVRLGRSVRYLLPGAVESYIKEKRLYEGKNA
jgi:nicotinate-nucleotide adenylyltransferase